MDKTVERKGSTKEHFLRGQETSYEIRTVSVGDLQKIWNIYIEGKVREIQLEFPDRAKGDILKEIRGRESMENLRKDIKSARQRWFLVTKDNGIVGIAGAYYGGGKSGWLTMLYIKEGSGKGNVESSLAEAAIDWLKGKDAKYASITARMNDRTMLRNLKNWGFESTFSAELCKKLDSSKTESSKVAISFRVRKAEISDIESIWDVFLEGKIDEQQLQFPGKSRIGMISQSIKTKTKTIKEWEEDLVSQKSYWIVAEKEGKIVGFASATVNRDGEGSLTNLYVVRQFRRMGIGRYLIQMRLHWLKENGVKVVYTHAFYKNKPSLENLKSLGFELTNSGTYHKRL
jgi:N-acetylglutamate synthase-like GNAT family acetyltransferase